MCFYSAPDIKTTKQTHRGGYTSSNKTGVTQFAPTEIVVRLFQP